MAQKNNNSNSSEQLVADRYNRQELISGWNQGKIRNSYIALIGSGPLANFTSAALVSTGYGNVEIYDNALYSDRISDEFLLSLTKKAHCKVDSLEEILSKINPLVRVKGIQSKINSKPLAQLLGNPNVIVDLTNDIQSQATVLEYGQSKKIPVIIAAANYARGEFYIKLPNEKNKVLIDLKDYQNQQQGAIPSEVLGGIIPDEIRKIIMPFDKNEKPVSRLSYSMACPQRFNGKDKLEINPVSLKNKHILIVGAGALGNFVGIGSALAGIGKIDILDFDDIETTNLNRQILFYDSVGNEKSKSLAEQLKKINPRLNIRGIVGKLDENYSNKFKSRENRPDLILDCVDNFGTRAIVNYFAVRYEIPLISGGTSPSSGQVIAYKPGESSCLNCKLSVDKALGKERTSHSCIHAAQPSVVTTNETIGGTMICEALSVLAPKNYGPHIKKMLKYDSTNPARAGLIGGDQPCTCKKAPIKEWLKDVVKKAE